MIEHTRQTRETVFHRHIKTPREELEMRRAVEIRGVWISDETLSRVFLISSRLIKNKEQSQIVNIYTN